MTKKSFKAAPTPIAPQADAIDRFVQSGPGKDSVAGNTQMQKAVNEEPLKRLTIEVPKSLHTRFKALCAQHETKMADEFRAFMERRCQELDNPA